MQPVVWIVILIICLNQEFNYAFRKTVGIVGLALTGMATCWALYDSFFICIDCLEIIYSKTIDIILITYEHHNWRRRQNQLVRRLSELESVKIMQVESKYHLIGPLVRPGNNILLTFKKSKPLAFHVQ